VGCEHPWWLLLWLHAESEACNQFLVGDTPSSVEQFPQKSHDHSEQEIYIGILLHHAFSFGHQGHVHQNREPALYLPEKL
jgi:hypothetical protein